VNHWRNWLPPTYYVTHGMAPLMYMTDTWPTQLNALSMIDRTTQAPNTVKVGDVGSLILCRMDNGSVFRIWGLMMNSIHRVRYELHGERGLLSTGDMNCGGMVRVHREDWLRKPGQDCEKIYAPQWPEHGALAAQAGHGGGDFWTMFHFANAIRSGVQPYLDVYRGTAMAAVSILGWRSCLENGRPFDIPDFHKAAERAAFADDHWSPFLEDAGPGQPPPSLLGVLKPSAKAIAHARKVWRSTGYTGK